MKIKIKKGFTLVELMVVCVIIAILAIVAMVSYKNAKAQSRDARRKSDLDTIASAVKLYYEDNGTFQLSPAGKNSGGNGLFNCASSGGYSSTSLNAFLASSSNTPYLSGTIQDPLKDNIDSNGNYCNLSGHYYTYDFSTTTKQASVWGTLENPSADDTNTLSTAFEQPSNLASTSKSIGNTSINFAINILP